MSKLTDQENARRAEIKGSAAWTWLQRALEAERVLALSAEVTNGDGSGIEVNVRAAIGEKLERTMTQCRASLAWDRTITPFAFCDEETRAAYFADAEAGCASAEAAFVAWRRATRLHSDELLEAKESAKRSQAGKWAAETRRQRAEKGN